MSEIYIPTGMELIDLVNSGEYICNNCGAIMDLKEDPDGGCDILVCPNCGEEVDEMDYEYEWGDDDEDNSDKTPKGCIACGGPYPQCTSSCKLFD
jgi:DNA-directed RNA polymerase subunit RPC12/RpoP